MPAERMLFPVSPRVRPPPDPHASQYRQWVGAGRLVLPCCGETVRWASWYRKTQIPQGTRYCWKTPDPPPRHPPAEIQAKGAGWGASPRHPASSRVPTLHFMVPGSRSGPRALCGVSHKE